METLHCEHRAVEIASLVPTSTWGQRYVHTERCFLGYVVGFKHPHESSAEIKSFGNGTEDSLVKNDSPAV